MLLPRHKTFLEMSLLAEARTTANSESPLHNLWRGLLRERPLGLSPCLAAACLACAKVGHLLVQGKVEVGTWRLCCTGTFAE